MATTVRIEGDTADAGLVRQWARGRLSKIPEHLRAGVLEGARGRVNPEVVALFEAANPELKVVTGSAPKVERTAKLKYKPEGSTRYKTVTLPLAEIRRLAGQDPSTRGRISEATLEVAGEAYGREQSGTATTTRRPRKRAQKAAQSA